MYGLKTSGVEFRRAEFGRGVFYRDVFRRSIFCHNIFRRDTFRRGIFRRMAIRLEPRGLGRPFGALYTRSTIRTVKKYDDTFVAERVAESCAVF